MKVALYARVSTERQQERGTISSQLEALRAAASADGDEVIEEFVDDGYSGARLHRPALDRLRDAAEAGALDGVICLCADRLARVYAYQVLIIDELSRLGVSVRFLEGPAQGEDPATTLLVQMQGVIAEYERAKIAERYRRGKLYRARQGEIPFWKTSYGHRRVIPAEGGPARIEVFEPEAEIARWIFHAYVETGRSIRQIAMDLLDRGIPSPTRNGRSQWPHRGRRTARKHGAPRVPCRGRPRARRRRMVRDIPRRPARISIAPGRRQHRSLARDDRAPQSDRPDPGTARRATPTDSLPDTTVAPENGNEMDPDLLAAIAELPDKQRHCVAYHYVVGLAHQEIAEIIGGTPTAARRAAADGIQTLRRTYAPLLQSDPHKDTA